jgi:predicted nucleic acid-binding protein
LFWEQERHKYNLYTSDAVYGESIRGDSDAAQRRIIFLEGIAVLPVMQETTILADIYQHLLQVPERAKTDCIHLAICVLSRIDYLLTWNCKHLGIQTWEKVRAYNETRGLWMPILTTPEQLTELDMEDVL